MLMNMWIIRKNSMKNHFLKKLFLHIYKKRKYTLDTRAVLLIFAIELNICGGRTEHTSKKQKMVTFATNCLEKMTLRLF